MRRLAHTRALPPPLVSLHYYIHDPITSYHLAPRNLERRPRVSRAAAVFDIIPKHLATYCKHPMYMRADQRDHFCTRQRSRVTDPVVMPQPVHLFPDQWGQPIHCRHHISPVKYSPGVHREYPPRSALHAASHSGVFASGNSHLLYTAS